MIAAELWQLRREIAGIRQSLFQVRRYRHLTPEYREALMALVLDNLTAAVSSLEAAASAVSAEVGQLRGTDDQGPVDALTGRIQSVVTGLNQLVPPAPEPAPEA